MQMHWQGHYLDGITATRHPVNIILTPAGIQIKKTDGSVLLWQYNEVTQTQGYYAGEQIRLERGADPVEVLVVSNTEFLNVLRFMASSSAGKFHDPAIRRKRLLWIILAVIGTIGGLSVLYMWGIPAGAKVLADHVPPEWEAKLGEAVAKELTAGESMCTETLPKQSIEHIIQTLNSAALKHPYQFKVYLVKDETVNALAAPGGHIIIFTGLLEQTKNAEELAGVLAHEMQHILQKHATKSIFQSFSIRTLIAIVLGDPGIIGDVIGTLGSLNYSRTYEEEADYLGMELLLKANINPTGMIDFFHTMNKKYGNEPELFRYVSTHPLIAERIRKLEDQAKKASITPKPLLSEVSWQQLVKSCV